MTTMTAPLVRTGQCRVTIRNEAGQHMTYRVRACKPWTNSHGVEVPGVGYWIDVDNTDDWLPCGKLDESGAYYPTRNALTDPGARYGASLVGMALAAGCPDSLTVRGREYDVRLEDRCGRCGRELTDPVSIERGLGPECYGKATGSKRRRVA